MKKKLLLLLYLPLMASVSYADPLGLLYGVGTLTSAGSTYAITRTCVTNSNKLTNAMVENIEANTENIKKSGGIQIVPQPDGTAKVYNNGVLMNSPASLDPNSAEYQMAMRMGNTVVNYFERKDAKARLKQIKGLAKIEGDKETLKIIKKYKKAGAVVTLQKLEEAKNESARTNQSAK